MAKSDQPRYDELADAELLDRFLSGRDEAAFAAIVRRHHGLVYGVCRRRLLCPHDAEDAFQATFLVLAQKGHKIASRDSLASWLYGVAYRVALRLARQRAASAMSPLEEPVMVHDDPLVQLAQRHEQIVTDEELAALPERLRVPVVLRYLAGKSNEQVAAELAISVAAVEGRLKRAKQKLRGRLVRRGIALSTTLASVGAANWQTAHAAEPLIAQTIAACLGGSPTAVAASGAAATTTASAGSTVKTSQTALQLAQKEALAMTTLKLSNAAAIAAVIICTTTVGFGLRQAFSQSSDDPFAADAGGGLVLDQGGNAGGGTSASDPTDPFSVSIGNANDPFGAGVTGAATSGARSSGTTGAVAANARRTAQNVPFDMKIQGAAQMEIRKALEGDPVTMNFVDFPLSDVMDDLSNRYKMHIELDNRALQDLGIDASRLITATYRGMTLRSALKLMLEPLDLTYIIEDEYLLVTTVDEAEQRLDTRIYPIRPQWGVAPNDLMTAMTATVHPVTWEQAGGPGSVKPLGENLIITQTQKVHEDIVDLLEQLERASGFRAEQGFGTGTRRMSGSVRGSGQGEGGIGPASSGYDGGYGSTGGGGNTGGSSSYDGGYGTSTGTAIQGAASSEGTSGGSSGAGSSATDNADDSPFGP